MCVRPRLCDGQGQAGEANEHHASARGSRRNEISEIASHVALTASAIRLLRGARAYLISNRLSNHALDYNALTCVAYT